MRLSCAKRDDIVMRYHDNNFQFFIVKFFAIYFLFETFVGVKNESFRGGGDKIEKYWQIRVITRLEHDFKLVLLINYYA